MLHHLVFVVFGAAVSGLPGSAAPVFCGFLICCQECRGALPCGVLFAHRSAKNGYFGEYLNVFAVFCEGFSGFFSIILFQSAMDF